MFTWATEQIGRASPRVSSCWRKHTAPETLRWTHPKHVGIPSFFIYLVTYTCSLQTHRLSPNTVCMTQADAASKKGFSKEGVNLSPLWEGGQGADTEECLPSIVQRTTTLKHWYLPSGLAAWWKQGRKVHLNNFRKISDADWKWSSRTHKRIKHHYLFLLRSAEFSYLSFSRSSEEMLSLRSKLQILDRAVADDSRTCQSLWVNLHYDVKIFFNKRHYCT